MLSFSLVAASTLFLRANAITTPTNLVTPSVSGALSGLKYTHVGQDGSYDQVTNIIPGTFPSCTANPSCITQPKSISGNLAPFDEDLTMIFRGPMNIENIAVYQPDSTSSPTWNLVSSWAANQQPNNLVFMNNDGGGKSGEWSICAGASQSYANGTWDGSAATANADTYSGFLPEAQSVNIMTATSCAQTSCPGFSRGTANMGWEGSKAFVVTFDMPPSNNADNVPAMWILNGQIVRSAQYGCNCRTNKFGCGEVDILETLPPPSGNADQCISEMYALNSATGSGQAYFARPQDGNAVTYIVIFDVESDSIMIQHLTQWDYSQTSVSRDLVEGYLSTEAMAISLGGTGGSASDSSSDASTDSSTPAAISDAQGSSSSILPSSSSLGSASSTTPTCRAQNTNSKKRATRRRHIDRRRHSH